MPPNEALALVLLLTMGLHIAREPESHTLSGLQGTAEKGFFVTTCSQPGMLWHRTAQKRYRERQKEKMQDFERQVEELSSRVSALMREKANLESRNSLLERVVQLKDATEAAPPQVGLCT